MALPTSFMISHSGLTMTFLRDPTMVVPTISGLAPVPCNVVHNDLTTFCSFSPRAIWEQTRLSATSSREQRTWIKVLSMCSITWRERERNRHLLHQCLLPLIHGNQNDLFFNSLNRILRALCRNRCTTFTVRFFKPVHQELQNEYLFAICTLYSNIEPILFLGNRGLIYEFVGPKGYTQSKCSRFWIQPPGGRVYFVTERAEIELRMPKSVQMG